MNCKNCKKQGCSLAGKSHEMSFECRLYVGKTNADRIRAMTDEELADELLEWFACFMAVEWSRDMILDYLKQEATDV